MDFDINEVRRITRERRPDADTKRLERQRTVEAAKERQEAVDWRKYEAHIEEEIQQLLRRVEAAAAEGESHLIITELRGGSVKKGGKTIFN